ncbi:MAG: polymer-forming cytoskeletal protein [Acidobacteriota bacterium]|nr:MAG: polymer-forming cytoskeletal protein [Acidobacteriota bacterium]
MAMWGRKEQDESRSTATPAETPKPARSTTGQAPARGVGMEERKAIIGPSIQVKGELIGSEDLVIEGRIEGVVRLRDHHLTIGKQAHIAATLEAKSIRVEGTVKGDVVAGERLELAAGSTLNGDIVSPRIVIADGAQFKGSVDMDRSKRAPSGAPAPATAKPQTADKSVPSSGTAKPVGVSS